MPANLLPLLIFTVLPIVAAVVIVGKATTRASWWCLRQSILDGDRLTIGWILLGLGIALADMIGTPLAIWLVPHPVLRLAALLICLCGCIVWIIHHAFEAASPDMPRARRFGYGVGATIGSLSFIVTGAGFAHLLLP